ncbi:MAG: SBBP repeat-containing protein [Bacteroidetes bacterium]|jgi:hypothetical protein|nr:SBBP repeat-containing protein [Bacteroidota bacterium]
MKKILLFVAVTSQFNISSQNLNFNYAKTISSPGNEIISGICNDNNGNLYSVGYFDNTADFDESAGTYTMQAVFGSNDIFIRKHDSNNNFIWAKQIGGTVEETAYDVATDNFGNIYIVGSFKSLNCDFDPSPTATYTVAGNSADAFILKLSSNGDFKWVKSIGGAFDDYFNRIVVDKQGNVFAAGYIKDYTDADPNSGTVTLNPSNGHAIILSLDSIGTYRWSKQVNGGYDQFINEIGLDNHDHIYSVGYFNYSSSNNIYIGKHTTSGTNVWTKDMGATSNEDARGLAIDTINNNIYVTGLFNGTTDFDPNSGIQNLTSATNDGYILKLDSGSNFIWVQQIGGPGLDYGVDISTDHNGNIYNVGIFKNSVDFDPSPTSTFTLNGGSSFEIYMLKLDNNGTFMGANQIGNQLNETLNGIYVDKNNCISIFGTYKGTVDFDISPTTSYSLTANGSNPEAFIANYCEILNSLKDNISENETFTVFPNPSNGTFHIKTDELKITEYQIIISNILGETIFEMTTTEKKLSIQLDHVPSGIYNLSIKNNNYLYTKKIIKQ